MTKDTDVIEGLIFYNTSNYTTIKFEYSNGRITYDGYTEGNGWGISGMTWHLYGR